MTPLPVYFQTPATAEYKANVIITLKPKIYYFLPIM